MACRMFVNSSKTKDVGMVFHYYSFLFSCLLLLSPLKFSLTEPFKTSLDGESESPVQSPPPPPPSDNSASQPIRTPGRNKKKGHRR